MLNLRGATIFSNSDDVPEINSQDDELTIWEDKNEPEKFENQNHQHNLSVISSLANKDIIY